MGDSSRVLPLSGPGTQEEELEAGLTQFLGDRIPPTLAGTGQLMGYPRLFRRQTRGGLGGSVESPQEKTTGNFTSVYREPQGVKHGSMHRETSKGKSREGSRLQG